MVCETPAISLELVCFGWRLPIRASCVTAQLRMG